VTLQQSHLSVLHEACRREKIIPDKYGNPTKNTFQYCPTDLSKYPYKSEVYTMGIGKSKTGKYWGTKNAGEPLNPNWSQSMYIPAKNLEYEIEGFRVIDELEFTFKGQMVVIDTANELKLDMDRIPVKDFVTETAEIKEMVF
jgi:hypothetical protein